MTATDRRTFVWKLCATAAVLSLAIGASVFVAVRAAVARDGVPGGAARSFVTVAGTVTGVASPARMRFAFHRRGVAAPLCAPVVPVTVGSDGAFAAPVPLDDAASPCPGDLFDGSDVEVDVAVNDTVVVSNSAINPVPYAHYATQVGTSLCPARYVCEAPSEAGWSCDPTMVDDVTRGLKVRCVRKRADGAVYDEVVRVGTANSAFWIDRYEASVWGSPTGTGTAIRPPVPDTFPPNGQAEARNSLYALSQTGAAPDTGFTWFQANRLCRASGKRLPSGDEWLAAASATNDPGENSGVGGACVTLASAARPTGMGTTCVSTWGAEDMIGNVQEWTTEWYVGVGQYDAPVAPWPSIPEDLYRGDGTWNVAGRVQSSTGITPSLPAAPLRGGNFTLGTRAGVFSLMLLSAPSYGYGDRSYGFRCVIPR